MPRAIGPYDRQDVFWESPSSLMLSALATATIFVFLVLPHVLAPASSPFWSPGSSPSGRDSDGDPASSEISLREVIPVTPIVLGDPNPAERAEGGQDRRAESGNSFTAPDEGGIPIANEVIFLDQKPFSEDVPRITRESRRAEVVAPAVETVSAKTGRENPPVATSLAERRAQAEADGQLVARQGGDTMAEPVPGGPTAGLANGQGGLGAQANAGAGIDPEKEQYYRRVRDIIKGNFFWVSLPGAEESNLATTVHIPVRAGGDITAIRVIESSGNRSFDQAVVRAINKSNPLPAMPSVFGGQSVTMQLKFKPSDLR